MQMSVINQKKIEASIKNLEVQVVQLATQLSEHGSGSFSTNTHVNPKEQRNSITTKRGTMVGLKENDEKQNKEGVENEKEKNEEVVTSEKVEENVISEEKKQKSKNQVSHRTP